MKAMTTAILGLVLAGTAWAQEGSYLEIPVKGKLGEEITVSGVQKALQGAKAAGVQYIVFNVDCDGGDQLVCKELVQVLGSADKAFKFVAVVTQATGTGVVFTVRADRIFVRPGAKIGGVRLNMVKAEQEIGVGADVILSNIALNAGVQAKEHGRSPELVRAMIDPAEAVYAWKGADGKPEFGKRLPEGIAKENVLLEHKGKGVLTLNDAELVALGFATKFEGGIDALGKELKVEGWASKGNATATMTQAATAEKKEQDAAKGDRQKFLIDQNRKRREATKAGIERFLDLSHEWNPKLATYSTYKEWNGYWDGSGSDTGRLTPEARRKWQDRTDITVSALSKASAGIVEMKKLEKEAKSLGQEPMYPEGKLETMYEDVNLTMTMIEKERDKRFRDDK